MEKILKSAKQLTDNATEQFNEVIYKTSHKKVLQQLRDDGIDVNDVSKEEFNHMLAEEIKTQKSFTKGAAIGAGALLFLDLLG